MLKLMTFLLSVALALPLFAQNSVLAQLGAKGATETGGTALYGHYLVRLGTNGAIDASMLPTGMQTLPLGSLAYIDLIRGADNSTQLGSAVSPYRTLSYAVSNYAYAASTGVVYSLLPGTYPSTTLNPLVNAGLSQFTLWGSDSQTTYIPVLDFESVSPGAAVTLDLAGVRIGTLIWGRNKPLTLHLLTDARIDSISINADYTSQVIVYRDSASVVAAANLTYTEILTSRAQGVGYTNAGRPYMTVKSALDGIDTRLLNMELFSNTISWTANSWSNSVAFLMTTNDLHNLRYAPCMGITVANINSWNSPTNVTFVTSSNAMTSATVGGNYLTDLRVFHNFNLALTNDITLLNPTNGYPGTSVTWLLGAGTPSRAVTLDSGYVVPSSAYIPNPFNVGSNTTTCLSVIYNGTNWLVTGFIEGY